MEHSLERRKRKCRRHFPRRSWRSKQLPLNKCFLNFYISKAVKITQKHAFLGWNTFIPNFRKYCFVHDLYPGIFWMELYGNILKYTNIFEMKMYDISNASDRDPIWLLQLGLCNKILINGLYPPPPPPEQCHLHVTKVFSISNAYFCIQTVQCANDYDLKIILFAPSS